MKKRLVAEFLGTFFLLFIGTGAIVVGEITGKLSHLEISLVFGLVVMTLIYTFGHISGTHINPVVSICFLVYGDMKIVETVQYIIVQILGGIFGSLAVFVMFGNVANLGATLPSGTWQQSFVLEFILTFFLVIVFMSCSVHAKANKPFAGLSVGAIIIVEALFGGPISGASMNPIRSIAPALISGNLNNLWIYIVAPVLGGIVATMAYKLIHD